MNHWLLKSEPSVYSYDDLARDGETRWDGIRNFEARNNLRAMDVGDRCFFYHSNDERAVVGIARVVTAAYADPKGDGDWSAVDVAAVKKLSRPVPLTALKADPLLENMAVVKKSRLSVSPVTASEWARIVELGGESPRPGRPPAKQKPRKNAAKVSSKRARG